MPKVYKHPEYEYDDEDEDDEQDGGDGGDGGSDDGNGGSEPLEIVIDTGRDCSPGNSRRQYSTQEALERVLARGGEDEEPQVGDDDSFGDGPEDNDRHADDGSASSDDPELNGLG